VTYGGKAVLKHAALAEIFVPYHPGRPRPEDSVDGMGTHLAELLPGKDCIPGTVCAMFDAEGGTTGKRVVAMHEESAGLVYMGEAGRAYGKMLVLWCSSRLGGYTYLIRWRFRDDGMLMPEVGLTGKLEHSRIADASPQGSIIDREEGGGTRFAPSHVHNFYYRLDFDIDGPANDVVEEFTHRQVRPGQSLDSEDTWTPLLRETSRALDGNGVFRGSSSEAFAQADLWAVRARQREFPLSAADGRTVKQALPTYVNGETLDGQDVAVWYAMHVHHQPRSEDWPAMPVEWAGFTLMPRDFLDRSPLAPQ
jgi:primary-amine oxidase